MATTAPTTNVSINTNDTMSLSRRSIISLLCINALLLALFMLTDKNHSIVGYGNLKSADENCHQAPEEQYDRRLVSRNPDETRGPYEPVEEFVLDNDGISAYMKNQGIPQDLPLIYFVTPTYNRTTQMVDMIRLSQTLMHDHGIYWIVIEDWETCTRRIRGLLERTGLMFAHIHTPTIKENTMRHRGVMQRNQALDLIDTLDNYKGIVYFGDDDNGYDIRLFSELRTTRAISVFGVAFVGGGHYERCIVGGPHEDDDSVVVGFATNFRVPRSVGLDMGGLAFHTDIIRAKKPRFQNYWMSGLLESEFVKLLIEDDDAVMFQPLNNHCQNIYVWHVKTTGAIEKPVQNDPNYYHVAALI